MPDINHAPLDAAATAEVHFTFPPDPTVFTARFSGMDQTDARLQDRVAAVLTLIGAQLQDLGPLSATAQPTDDRLLIEVGAQQVALQMLGSTQPFEGVEPHLAEHLAQPQNGKEPKWTALIDPRLVFDADMMEDDPALQVEQLRWDTDKNVNQQAPYLVQFKPDARLITRLASTSEAQLDGLWDHQVPFLMQSDLPLSAQSKMLSGLSRPMMQDQHGKPYLRFWDSGMLLSVLLSGELAPGSVQGGIVFGIGPANQRQLVRLDMAETVKSHRLLALGPNAQIAISATHRHNRVQALASSLCGKGDSFALVLAMTQAAISLGARYGFETARARQRLAEMTQRYGLGFMHDLQFPQLAVVLQTSPKMTQSYRLALLKEWDSYVTELTGPPSYARDMDRLAAGVAVLDAVKDTDTATTPRDVVAWFETIDAAKTKLHSKEVWEGIVQGWMGYFVTAGLSNDAAARMSVVAFCVGQFWAHDPLRSPAVYDALGDLLPKPIEVAHG